MLNEYVLDIINIIGNEGGGSGSNPNFQTGSNPGGHNPQGGEPGTSCLTDSEDSSYKKIKLTTFTHLRKEYDPAGDYPPTNKKELYDLLQYRIARVDNHPSNPSSFSVGRILYANTLVNNGAKSLLLEHILDNKIELSTAYKQYNMHSTWSPVSISATSPIMYSLSKSF